MELEHIAIGSNASMFRKLDFQRIKGVYHPKSEEELIEIIKKVRQQKLSITAKGGGTGLSGACTGGNRDRVIITSRAMQRVLEINTDKGYVLVESGITPKQLNAILQPYDFRFYVTPSSDDAATLGGMVSTDAGGADAWLNGTMYDNTLAVKLIDYLGRTIWVSRNKIESSDPSLASELQAARFNLMDLAQSHGVLGFISAVKVMIRPIKVEPTKNAIIHFSNYDTFGRGLNKLIDSRAPLYYSETIVEAHSQFKDLVEPPLIIIKYPETNADTIEEINGLKEISEQEFLRMRKLRLDLPKMNPTNGIQKAFFEGYGFDQHNLNRFSELMSKIDDIWIRDGYPPYIRYGHGPCKWYVNDKPVYGLIMHAREIAGNQTGSQVFKTLKSVIELCNKENIIPKPEHKWPYIPSKKRERLNELVTILQPNFNSFILNCTLEELEELVW